MALVNMQRDLRGEFAECGRQPETLRFELLLAKYVDAECVDQHWWRLEKTMKAWANSEFCDHALDGSSGNFRVAGTQEQEYCWMVGSSIGIDRFETLGREAACTLPFEQRSAAPFHDFVGTPTKRFSDLQDWIQTVFEQIRDGGMIAAIEFEDNWPKPGCCIAQLTMDPFRASVFAIDQLCSEPDAWPPDGGWHFRIGEAAFAQHRFEIEGRLHTLLTALATAGRALSASELCDALERDGTAPERDTVRGYVTELRQRLRGEFRLPKTVDPIPHICGCPGGWKLENELLRGT